jgi:hypothetical protein
VFVYITQAGEGGPVKIGFSARLTTRMRTLSTGTHEALRVLRVIEGGHETERWMHERFAASRRRGEWFNFDPEMMTVLPPDPDTLRVEEQKQTEDLHKMLCEMRECVLRVASDLPPEGKIVDRLKLAAERYNLPFSRVRAFYYLQARTVLASEADRIRLVTRSFLSEYAERLEQQAQQIRRALAAAPRHPKKAIMAREPQPDLFRLQLRECLAP